MAMAPYMDWQLSAILKVDLCSKNGDTASRNATLMSTNMRGFKMPDKM